MLPTAMTRHLLGDHLFIPMPVDQMSFGQMFFWLKDVEKYFCHIFLFFLISSTDEDQFNKAPHGCI
jgi:hypothetical protein